MKGHTSTTRRSRGSLTVEIAKRMGRDRMPLRIRMPGRILVLANDSHRLEHCRITVESGRRDGATLYIFCNSRPSAYPESIVHNCTAITIDTVANSRLVDAWLNGFYGGAA